MMVAQECECTWCHRTTHLHVVTMVCFTLCAFCHTCKSSRIQNGLCETTRSQTSFSLKVHDLWWSMWPCSMLQVKKPGFPTGSLLYFSFPMCKIKRRSQEAVETNIHWAVGVPEKCHVSANYYFLFFPFLAPPHLWEVSVHVLMCDGRICDKFKEFPHSHHGNTVLQKEICWKENTVQP